MHYYISTIIYYFGAVVLVIFAWLSFLNYRKNQSRFSFLITLAAICISFFLISAGTIPFMGFLENKYIALISAFSSMFLFFGFAFMGSMFTALKAININFRNTFFIFLIYGMFALVLRLIYLPLPTVNEVGFISWNFPLPLKITNYLFATMIGLVNGFSFISYAKRTASRRGKIRSVLLGLAFIFGFLGGDGAILTNNSYWLTFFYGALFFSLICVTISFFLRKK